MTGRIGSYRSYLRLDRLLALQYPVTPEADARTRAGENFFIICHQASELCASQIFVDLDCAATMARAGDWASARTCVTRAVALVRLARSHLTMLLYLPVTDFHGFRDALSGSSGAESEQFTALLLVSRHPNVRAIKHSLAAALPAIALDAPHQEGACEHDACATARAVRALIAGAAMWRRRHARIARHFIGDLPGTGGTSGVSYLLRAEPGDDDTADGGKAKRVTSPVNSRRQAVR
jgi:tryptophan 2,3-dioxygenase